MYLLPAPDRTGRTTRPGAAPRNEVRRPVWLAADGTNTIGDPLTDISTPSPFALAGANGDLVVAAGNDTTGEVTLARFDSSLLLGPHAEFFVTGFLGEDLGLMAAIGSIVMLRPSDSLPEGGAAVTGSSDDGGFRLVLFPLDDTFVEVGGFYWF